MSIEDKKEYLESLINQLPDSYIREFCNDPKTELAMYCACEWVNGKTYVEIGEELGKHQVTIMQLIWGEGSRGMAGSKGSLVSKIRGNLKYIRQEE